MSGETELAPLLWRKFTIYKKGSPHTWKSTDPISTASLHMSSSGLSSPQKRSPFYSKQIHLLLHLIFSAQRVPLLNTYPSLTPGQGIGRRKAPCGAEAPCRTGAFCVVPWAQWWIRGAMWSSARARRQAELGQSFWNWRFLFAGSWNRKIVGLAIWKIPWERKFLCLAMPHFLLPNFLKFIR